MTNFRRALLAILTFVGITAGSLAVGTGIASAHSYEKTATCTSFTFHALDNYEGNATNNSVTLTLDGAPQTFFFDQHGITKVLPFTPGPASHTWRIDINANINTGNDKTGYDVNNDHGSVGGCPVKPADGFTDRTVDGVCTIGANTVDVKVYRTPFTWTFTNGAWVKTVGAEFLFSTTPRNLTAQEQITCKPSHEPKVVTVDSGEPKCGDTTVATTTTTTNYTYAYVNGHWVETKTDVVTHGTREIAPTTCPTTPPTTVPPTTVPPTTIPPTTTPPTTQPPAVCVYNTNLPADSPLCVPPTIPTTVPPTVAPTTVVPPQLPATGTNNAGMKFAIAGILVLGGAAMMLIRRKPRNA